MEIPSIPLDIIKDIMKINTEAIKQEKQITKYSIKHHSKVMAEFRYLSSDYEIRTNTTDEGVEDTDCLKPNETIGEYEEILEELEYVGNDYDIPEYHYWDQFIKLLKLIKV